MNPFGWLLTQESTEKYGRNTSYYQMMAFKISMPNYYYRKLENDNEDVKS